MAAIWTRGSGPLARGTLFNLSLAPGRTDVMTLLAIARLTPNPLVGFGVPGRARVPCTQGLPSLSKHRRVCAALSIMYVVPHWTLITRLHRAALPFIQRGLFKDSSNLDLEACTWGKTQHRTRLRRSSSSYPRTRNLRTVFQGCVSFRTCPFSPGYVCSLLSMDRLFYFLPNTTFPLVYYAAPVLPPPPPLAPCCIVIY